MLALDTSTTVRVALARPSAPRAEPDPPEDGDPRAPRAPGHGTPTVLAARTETDPRRHVELLAPAVATVLAGAGVARSQVSHVVVGTGPAPFTGLRVGVVTALVLAEALGVAAAGVCSLDAVVATALDQAARGGAPLAGEVLAATDAKRREVHWARYRVLDGTDPLGGWERADGPRVGAAGEVPDLPVVGGGALLLGRGGPDALAADGLDPGVLAALAVHRLEHGLPLEEAAPRYLRRPDARPMAAS